MRGAKEQRCHPCLLVRMPKMPPLSPKFPGQGSCPLSLSFKFCFICLRDRRIVYILIDSPKGPNHQVWTRPKPGTRSFILHSHVHGWSPDTWAIFPCFSQAFNGEPDQKWNSGDSNCHSRRGHWWQERQLDHGIFSFKENNSS